MAELERLNETVKMGNRLCERLLGPPSQVSQSLPSTARWYEQLLGEETDPYISVYSGDAVVLLLERRNRSLRYANARDYPAETRGFAGANIPEFWEIEKTENRVTVHSKPHGKTYNSSTQFQRGDSITHSTAPTISFTVGELLDVT